MLPQAHRWEVGPPPPDLRVRGAHDFFVPGQLFDISSDALLLEWRLLQLGWHPLSQTALNSVFLEALPSPQLILTC